MTASKYMSNLHYFFYETYYEDINFVRLIDSNGKIKKELIREELIDKIEEKNSHILNWETRDVHTCEQRLERMMKSYPTIARSFCLMTQYPGLLLGTGELHGVGIPGEFATGFSLDYVTGLPIIPGSAVKGVLHNSFSIHAGGVARELLLEIKPEITADLDMTALTVNIFGDSIQEKTDRNDNCYERDVFFNAVIASCPISAGRIFEKDTITPHRGNTEMMELAEPTPLTFLKIAPKISFCFRFLLRDSVLMDQEGNKIGVLRSDQKKELFIKLLCVFGIGAKTNVGYGVLAPVE